MEDQITDKYDSPSLEENQKKKATKQQHLHKKIQNMHYLWYKNPSKEA